MKEPTLGDLFRTIKEYSFDTFDRIEVAYWWLSHHHMGQWSQSYSDMCRLGDIYSPGACRNNPHNWEAYDACCEVAECTHESIGP